MSEIKHPGLITSLIADVEAAGGTVEPLGDRVWQFTVPIEIVGGGTSQFGIGTAGYYRDSQGVAHVRNVSRVREFSRRRGVVLGNS
jgi:hypothetical protein